MWKPVALLVVSNVFMTYAWYGHLKDLKNRALWIAVLASWGVAFFEYCFQVPANRLGTQHFSLPQLKVIQEVITMGVFGAFCVAYLKVPLTRNSFFAGLCLVGAVWFLFRDLPAKA
jgi:hypothetical protein